MKTLQKGKFFGVSKEQYKFSGLTIVNSSFYNFSHCPWHYHTNAHFAFTLRGKLTETHRDRKIDLSAGSLVYNHSQDPHWNHDYSENVAALHIDIDKDWFKKNEVDHRTIEGVHLLNNPVIKQVFYQLFSEISNFDTASPIAIESLMIGAINKMTGAQSTESTRPRWTSRLTDLLQEKCTEQLSLGIVAAELGIHPVYLSQQFPHWFNCNFGEYIRKLRVEKAVTQMMSCKDHSLTKIGYDCGFADQSHFIRTFKQRIGVTPLAFRKYFS